jgi:hypothetical protein
MNTRPGLLILRLVLGLVAGGYSLALVMTQLSGGTHYALAALFHVLHGEYGIGYLAVYGAAAFAVISPGSRE